MTTLFRATMQVDDAVGRTLHGMALPWSRPSLVRDGSGPSYYEAFLPTSCDVSMSQHATRPLYVRHAYDTDPIGTVRFSKSAAGLVFEAPLARTVRASEILELVTSNAMGGVSIGFRPIAQTTRQLANGDPCVFRSECALRELSVTAEGFAQYEDARVLAVRGEHGDGVHRPVWDALQRRRSRLELP
jgi:HK97 family phage prohead protease